MTPCSKTKKKVLLYVLKYKALSFLSQFPFICHIFNSLLHVVLSKLKTRNYYHEFYCSSLYCAKLVLNANMSIHLVCRITEIRQFIFHNLNMYMYFGLIRMVETLHKTNSIVFMSLHDYAYIISTLSTFSLPMSKEELGG